MTDSPGMKELDEELTARLRGLRQAPPESDFAFRLAESLEREAQALETVDRYRVSRGRVLPFGRRLPRFRLAALAAVVSGAAAAAAGVYWRAAEQKSLPPVPVVAPLPPPPQSSPAPSRPSPAVEVPSPEQPVPDAAVEKPLPEVAGRWSNGSGATSARSDDSRPDEPIASQPPVPIRHEIARLSLEPAQPQAAPALSSPPLPIPLRQAEGVGGGRDAPSPDIPERSLLGPGPGVSGPVGPGPRGAEVRPGR